MIITDRQVAVIKEFAKHAFRDRPKFENSSIEEIQIYCILEGLNRYLNQQGINPGYTMEGWKQEHSDPVDDSGLDEIEEEKPENG